MLFDGNIKINKIKIEQKDANDNIIKEEEIDTDDRK